MKNIALFNPSYQHPQEVSLWDSLYRNMLNHGFTPVEFQCRAVPDLFEGVIRYIFPARLKDFGKKIKFSVISVPSWLTEEEREFSVLWEQKRWSLNDSDKNEIEEGVIRIAQTIDLFFESHKPNLVIVYNEVDHPQRLAVLAAKKYGIPYIILERSPFMGVWFEPKGLFSNSVTHSCCVSNEDDSFNFEAASYLNILKNDLEGFRKNESKSIELGEDEYARPLVLLVLDNFLWTGCFSGSVTRFLDDYREFHDIEKTIIQLNQSVESWGGTLIVKPHPSCQEAKKLKLPHSVRFYDGALSSVLPIADVVVGWNSKVLFNALAIEKPVVCLGANPVLATEACYEPQSFDQIPSAISDAIHQVDFEAKLLKFKRYLPKVAKSAYFEIENGAVYNTGSPFYLFLDKVFSTLKFPLFESHASVDDWLNLCRGKLTDIRKNNLLVSGEYSVKVLFDATRLLKSNLKHTGISRYVNEIIVRGCESKRVHFTAVVKNGGGWQYYKGDELLNINDYDLFHSPHDPLDSSIDISRIVTLHDVVHLKLSKYYPDQSVPQSKYHIYKVLKSIRKNDFVLCDSKATMRDFLSFGISDPSNCRVAPLGADLIEFGEISHCNKSKRRIFAIYQNDPRKNKEVYLEIASHLNELDGRWKMVLIVPKGEKEVIEAHAKQLNISNLDLHENPDDTDKLDLMKGCDFSIFLPFYEGFGLPALESAAYGVPVITSCCSSLQEIDLPLVEFVSPFDIEGIKTVVDAWVTEPDKLPNVSQEAVQSLEKYSWSEAYNRVENSYVECKNKNFSGNNEAFSVYQNEQFVNPREVNVQMLTDSKKYPFKYFMMKLRSEFFSIRRARISISQVLVALLLSVTSVFFLRDSYSSALTDIVGCAVFVMCILFFYIRNYSLFERFVDYLKHVQK